MPTPSSECPSRRGERNSCVSRLPPAPYPSGLLPPPAALSAPHPASRPAVSAARPLPVSRRPRPPVRGGHRLGGRGLLLPPPPPAPSALRRFTAACPSLPALPSRPGSAAPAGASPVAQPPPPSPGAASAPAPAPSPPGQRGMPRVGAGGAGICRGSWGTSGSSVCGKVVCSPG